MHMLSLRLEHFQISRRARDNHIVEPITIVADRETYGHLHSQAMGPQEHMVALCQATCSPLPPFRHILHRGYALLDVFLALEELGANTFYLGPE